jgi:hypothetical protein
MTRTVRHAAAREAPSPLSRASARPARRCSLSPRGRPRRQARCAARSHTLAASPVDAESVHPLRAVGSGSEAAVEPEPVEQGRL